MLPVLAVPLPVVVASPPAPPVALPLPVLVGAPPVPLPPVPAVSTVVPQATGARKIGTKRSLEPKGRCAMGRAYQIHGQPPTPSAVFASAPLACPSSAFPSTPLACS